MIQLKDGQKIWTDISPKKTSRWSTDSWKDVQHHSSSGKCKSKPQWAVTSHLSRWLWPKKERQQVLEGLEKLEPLCMVGGDLRKMLQPQWETGWKFLKTLKIELSCDPANPLSIFIQKNWKQDLQEVLAFLCSLQHYLELQRLGNNLNVHQKMSG